MAGPWTLTVRAGSRVERERFPDAPGALDALEARARALGHETRRAPRSALGREYEPAAQVAARLELAGPGRLLRPGAQVGLDLRGDGSAEAWTGRVRREPVELGRGEGAVEAVRRVVLGSPRS